MDLQSASRFLLKQRITLFVNRYEYIVVNDDGSDGALVAFAEQKRLTLKEEINVYTTEAKTEVLFSLKAEKVLDIHGKFFVRDASGRTLGYLRKVFGRSLLRSTWEVYDADEKPMFTAQESNKFLAIFRRIAGEIPLVGLVVPLIPYHFEFVRGVEVVGAHRRHLGIRDHYDTTLEPAAGQLDRRVILALGIALDALQSR